MGEIKNLAGNIVAEIILLVFFTSIICAVFRYQWNRPEIFDFNCGAEGCSATFLSVFTIFPLLGAFLCLLSIKRKYINYRYEVIARKRNNRGK